MSWAKLDKSISPISIYKNIDEREIHELASELIEQQGSFRRSVTDHLENHHKRCLINISNPWRVKWDLFVMFLAIFNCFSIPYTLTFSIPPSTEDLIRDSVIDFLFFLDIILNFRTTYIHLKTGEEVTNSWKIAKKYLKGKFFIDVLASVPFDTIGSLFNSDTFFFQLFSLLKLIRILRLNKIILYMRTQETVKLWLRLLQFLLFVLMYLHIVACIWYLIVTQREEWSTIIPDFYEEDNYTRYFFSFYASVAMLVGIEISPQTLPEVIYVSVVLLIGALITAVLFGQMAVLVTDFNRSSIRFNSIMNDANTAMKNLKLPQRLQLEISDYLVSTQARANELEEFIMFKKAIPPSYHIDINDVLFTRIKVEAPIFCDNLNLVEELIRKVSNYYYQPEEFIIKQYQKSEFVFFQLIGKLIVRVVDLEQNATDVRILENNQFFGEVGVLFKTCRTASVIALEHASVARIRGDAFKSIMDKFPNAKDQLKLRTADIYKDQYLTGIDKLLKRVGFFKLCANLQYLHILHKMKWKVYKKRDIICDYEQRADKIVFLVSGVVSTYFSLRNEDYFISKYRDLSIFNGKLALLKFPMGIKIVATTLCKVLELSTQDIEKISVGIDGNLKGKLDLLRRKYDDISDMRKDYATPVIDAYRILTNPNESSNLKSSLKFKHVILKVLRNNRKKLNINQLSVFTAAIVFMKIKGREILSWDDIKNLLKNQQIPKEVFDIEHYLEHSKINNFIYQMGIGAYDMQNFIWYLNNKLNNFSQIVQRNDEMISQDNIEKIKDLNNLCESMLKF